MSNIVKYGEWTEEQAAQEEAEAATGGTFFKPKEGKNKIRFLPPAPGKNRIFKVVHEHGIGDGATYRSFPCPRMEAKKYCPACKRADELNSTGDPDDQKMAKQLFARRKVYANIVDMSDPDKGVQVFTFGKKIHEALLRLRQDGDAAGNFAHPETGRNIIIVRKGQGRDTEYTTMVDLKATPLANAEWLDQMVDLDRYGVLRDEASLVDALDSAGGSPDVQPARQAPKPVGRASTPEARRNTGSQPRARTAQDDIEEGSEEDIPF